MPQKEELIKRWTKSLDDNAEQQLHAMGMLHETIDPEFADLPKNVNALTEVTPTKQKHRARSLMFCAGLAVILFCIIAWHAAQMYPSLRYLWYSSSWRFKEPPAVATESPEEKFLLYGDATRHGKTNQMRALWEREPNNPAYYAEYSRFYYLENNALPPDFLKTAEQIDPDNGWFHYFAACVESYGLISNNRIEHPRSPLSEKDYSKIPHKDRRAQRFRVISRITITDHKLGDKALSLWRESLSKQNFDSYEMALYEKRFFLLRKYDYLYDLVNNYAYISSELSNFSYSHYFSRVIAATLQRDDLAPKEKELLMRNADLHLSRTLNSQPHHLLDLLVKKAGAETIISQIRVMNTEGIDKELVARWQKRADKYDQIRALHNQRMYEAHEVSWREASYFASSIASLNFKILEPIIPQPTEFAPLRYAEHSFTMRIVAIVFIILVILFFPFNLAFRRRKPLLRLGAEVWPSIPWSSHVKLFSWSVLVPISYFACLYWFTPLAGKDTGFKEMFLVPYAPAACVGLIMLVLPRILIHQSTKHWEMMGQQKKNWSLGLGWLCVILALIPMHGMTFPMFQDWSEDMLYTAIGCCMIPSLLWLIINGLRERFSRQPYRRVMHALRRTMLLPCSAANIVVLVCTIFALQSMETYWVKKDTLLELSPDAMTGGFEARVMKALDREQRQALGMIQE